MKMILTAGVLCAALLIAAVSTVQADQSREWRGEGPVPTVLVGE